MQLTVTRPLISVSCGLACGLALSLVGFSGCSSGTTDKPETAARDSAAEPADDQEEAPAKPKKSGTGRKSGKGGDGAHIGEIPKDVWPDVWLKQPLSVLAESGAAAGANPAPAAMPDAGQPSAAAPSTPTTVEKPAESAKAGAIDWKSLINGEVLADETKSLKNKLTAQLQDKGRYDSTYKQLRVDAAVMAVMAAIAPDVPDSPSWKTNAKFVRDTASTVAAESKNNGPQFYKKAKDAYDKLESLLSGSKPPDVADAAEHVNFSEIADRRYLMLRMERIKNWMKSDINAESIFKKEAAKVTQEASVLAVLARVITTPDYDSHDADDYKNFAHTISQSALGIVTAAKDNDFKAYTGLLDTYDKACLKCHDIYKN
ncbi:MAG: hypothetical protein JSS02_06420 [Planctomycetes bacterium]|nr:hypothetical protein [Planctomycetota bacterium]